MWPFSVKCLNCDNRISRRAANQAGGLCPDCARAKAEREAKFRAEAETAQREHERRIQTGEIYRPSEAEWDSATTPREFQSADGLWGLQPEFYREYREGAIKTVDEAIRDAESQSGGMLFLVSNLNGQLNFGFSGRFGVCEYVNEETGDWLYAHTEANLREQVGEQEHVVQSCPCCGVELLWYPSRFHMPKTEALELARALIAGNRPANVSWLDSGDFSWTEKGRG